MRLTIDLKLQKAAEKALAVRHPASRSRTASGPRDGGAIVALDPNDGSILAMASSPTYKPSVFTGRVTTKELARAGADDEDRAREELSRRSNRAPAGDVSAGLDVQARDRARRDAGAPRLAVRVPAVHRHLPLAERQVATSTFHNWDPNVNQQMDMPTALAYSCDTYFYQLGDMFFYLPTDRGQPLQKWARDLRLRLADRHRRRAGGDRPRADDRLAHQQHFTTAVDKLWKPGDSIQLAIGQGDLLVTPLQMARFYALLANGGKLVTPHVLMDVERPERHARAGARRRRAARRSASTRPRSRSSSRGSGRATHLAVRHVVSASSAPSPSRSPARRAPRRRS